MTAAARPTGRVRVGGPPAGARNVRSVLVLRGAPLQGGAFPGVRGKRDDRADEDGVPLPPVKAKQSVWPHVANRTAIAEVHAQRLLQRHVVVWEIPGAGWYVAVFDGWGQVVDDLTDEPFEDLDAARWVARAAWQQLRRLPAEHPHRWVLA